VKRITVTLREDAVEEIDRHDSNRSRFVQTAVARALERWRRRELERSLEVAHVEAHEVAEAGFAEWVEGGEESDLDLVDVASGTPVRWHPGRGWVQIEA
jgi:hypothetical protein